MRACKLAALAQNEHVRFEKVKKSSSTKSVRSEKKESEFCPPLAFRLPQLAAAARNQPAGKHTTADQEMNTSDVAGLLMVLKKRRLAHTCRVVKGFVKMSGGWSKAFPDKTPAVPKFDLASKEGSWCMEEMRMLSGDIIMLRKQLGIPNEFRTKNRDTSCGVDVLCMLLYRLSRSRNYRDLRATFGSSSHRIARLSNGLAVYLYNRFHRKLDCFDRERLTDEYLVGMARSQYAKNGVMRNIVGFIDATVRPCCRCVFCTTLLAF
jgi:hypothetical protein